MRMWRGCAYLKLWISWQWKTQYIFNNCVQSRYIRKRGLLSASTRDCLEGLVAARCGAAPDRLASFHSLLPPLAFSCYAENAWS